MMQIGFQPRTYTYNTPDGRKISVEEELWVWQAEYKDYTCLKQFDSRTGLFHKMAEVDKTKLKSLYITSSFYANTHVVIFPPDDPFELTIRHERSRREIGTHQDTGWFTFFVFGYRNLETNESNYLVIRGDEAVRTGDWRRAVV